MQITNIDFVCSELSRHKWSKVVRRVRKFSHDTVVEQDNEPSLGTTLKAHPTISYPEQKEMQASKLEAQLRYLKADIEEADRRLVSKTQLFSDGRGFLSKFIESSSTYSSEKSVGNAGAISTLSKSNTYEERLMRNIDQLESAYFSRCSRIGTPEFIAAMRSDYDVLKIRDRCSQLLNDTDEATDHLGTFFDGLCKFAQYSKFEVCGSLKNLDIVNSVNVICSLSFDRDEDYFAVAGVSKKIKIFEFGALLNESVDVHYPLIEMTSGSKLSYYRYADCSLLGGTAKIDRRQSILAVGGRLREKKERRRGEEERSTSCRRGRRVVAALAHESSPPLPAGDFSPARGDETSPRVGRKIEATSPIFF
ncbi:hypothetical protein B296_00057774 [Ensete ventricosum]|uniref:Uncharacterized protein n=1 Tax=Ensete ventricosum TaxID=4639 RepID=A0A426XAS6_ENSVE|nr:hypothetical protein B296_00057774 [Ensete ventricosum]